MPNRLAIAPSSAKYKAFRAVAGMERLLRGSRQTTARNLKSIRNFLFLQYDTPLGSAVHATPLYEAIKTRIPNAYIAVACNGLVASMLRNSPYVNQCVETPLPWRDFRGALHAVRCLYRQLPGGPVCIMTTASNQRPTLALLGLLAGKAVRAGYTLATPLYHLALDFDADRPQMESNVDILRALGHDANAPEPHVHFSQCDLDIAANLLVESFLPENAPRIAFVTQSSGGQPKLWRVDRFRDVIATLQKRYGANPVFLGTVNEAAAIKDLRRPLAQPGISLAGKTTIPQLAAVLAQCDAIVSLDTGTFHVARAVGLPGVVIAPAWQNPMEWLPVNHPRYRIACGPKIAMPGNDYWIEEVSVEDVLSEMDNLLDINPPSTDARKNRIARSLSKE